MDPVLVDVRDRLDGNGDLAPTGEVTDLPEKPLHAVGLSVYRYANNVSCSSINGVDVLLLCELSLPVRNQVDMQRGHPRAWANGAEQLLVLRKLVVILAGATELNDCTPGLHRAHRNEPSIPDHAAGID